MGPNLPYQTEFNAHYCFNKLLCVQRDGSGGHNPLISIPFNYTHTYNINPKMYYREWTAAIEFNRPKCVFHQLVCTMRLASLAREPKQDLHSSKCMRDGHFLGQKLGFKDGLLTDCPYQLIAHTVIYVGLCMQITQAMASNLCAFDEIEWTSGENNYRKQACIVFMQRRAHWVQGLSIFSVTKFAADAKPTVA